MLLGVEPGSCYAARVMDAVILSIGTELTTGQTVDTNAAWLSQRLTEMGMCVLGHVTVGDDVVAIQAAISRALDDSDLVVATGGLGPTPDDLTRQGLANALGVPLEENADALATITAMFERWGRHMHPSNRVQAMVPSGCEVIPNEHGTAPGIRHAGSRGMLIALPGVPSEMRAMFREAVAPDAQTRTRGARTKHAEIKCYGISEAKVGELLFDLMARDRNPLVGTTASNALISVRITSNGEDAIQAGRLLEDDVAEVRERLGQAVFGEAGDTLEQAVARLLLEKGLTLSTAESCTGGLVGKRLTDVPGSSVFYLGGQVTYSNESKTKLLGVPEALIERDGAVSEAVAKAMATGCRTALGSDLAVSVTGIAGPSGGSPPDKPVGLVYLGLADANGVYVKRVLLGDHLDRCDIRERAAGAALNLLRLSLLEADRG